MEDWKQNVAANLAALRKAQHLTQLQLAESLHYSDKAVSKWERGESLPDLAVLKQLADFYGVRIDDLLLTPEELAAQAEHEAPEISEEPEAAEETAEPAESAEPQADLQRRNINRLLIAGMAAMLVWLIASLIFVVLDAAVPELQYGRFLLIYALPVTEVVCLVFNSVWFNPRRNFLIISVLIWSLLGALYLTLCEFQIYIWKIFLVGIPAQLIVVLWSRIRKP